MVFLLCLYVPQAQTLFKLPPPPDSLIKADSLAKLKNEKKDSLVLADSTDNTPDTVTYSAVHIRYRRDQFSLANTALLSFKGSLLYADTIVYDHDQGIVEAVGGPMIHDPSNPSITGYKMRYNLKSKVGEIYYGSSQKDHQNFNGMEIRREKNGEVYLARGDFSTCNDPKHKHYYFYSRRMVMEPKSKVLSGPIVMNIEDVPIAVLPMMVIPLGKGRRSGILQPKFGGDQAQGFYMTNLGYYWAINDYTDFLLSGDLIEGEQGNFDKTNVNWNYRYVKRYSLSGSLGGKYYINEFDPANAGWHVDFTHDQFITPDGKQTLKGSGRFQSDATVVDRNALNEADKLKQTANANLGYRRTFDWNQAVTNLNLSQINNLTANQIERDIPDFTFGVSGPLFPVPEDENWETVTPPDPQWYQKLNYNYGNHFNIYQLSKPALNTARGDTNTYVGYSDGLSLSGKYSLWDNINWTPSINFNQLWSLNSKTGDSTHPFEPAYHPERGEVGDYFFRYNTSINFDTRLYGIAKPADNKPWFGVLGGIRHTLIPGVGVTYAPRLDSNTHLVPNPKIGGQAFQAEQRTVTFSLGNDVDIKLASEGDSALKDKKVEPYKILSATSTTNYNFANKLRPWSDISSSFSLYFTPTIAFTISTIHTFYDDYASEDQKNLINFPILKSYSFGWRKSLEVGGDFNTGTKIKSGTGIPGNSTFEKSPWSANMNYSFDFQAQRVGPEVFNLTRTHHADGGLRINPTHEWKMTYNTDYNFADGKFSKHTFGFARTLHCWQMDFNWTPVGISEGWSFNIRIIDLPDVKLESSNNNTRRFKR